MQTPSIVTVRMVGDDVDPAMVGVAMPIAPVTPSPMPDRSTVRRLTRCLPPTSTAFLLDLSVRAANLTAAPRTSWKRSPNCYLRPRLAAGTSPGQSVVRFVGD